MRIIHTADWHLGQNFMGKSREPEHRAFLDWLLQFIKSQKIDALIVAGDIYDTGTPPSYARQLYNRFVVEILGTRCQMVVVGGNHDSVAMLEESSDLFQHIGISQIARPSDDPADQVIELRRYDAFRGDLLDALEQPMALVCAVPFLRPRDIVHSTAGQDSDAKQLQLQTAIANHYKAVYDAAVVRCRENDWTCPIIATGHLTTVGVTSSDSVRDIYIGTLDAFPADAFPPADYMALGHIHSAQKVAKSDSIRYSGSPIPLSFDETRNKREKSVGLLTVGEGGAIETEIVPIPLHRRLQTICGSLEEIENQITRLSSDTDSDKQTRWLEVVIESQGYLNDLPQRIDAMLEDCNAEVLLLRRQRKPIAEALASEHQHTLSELTVEDIFEYRLKEEFPSAQSNTADDEERDRNTELKARLKSLHAQVVSEVQSGEAS